MMCAAHQEAHHSQLDMWKQAVDNLQDFYLKEDEDVIDIDETHFLLNLHDYLKKKKFCQECRENVLSAYENIKENADGPFDESDYEIEENCQNLIQQIKEHDFQAAQLNHAYYEDDPVLTKDSASSEKDKKSEYIDKQIRLRNQLQDEHNKLRQQIMEQQDVIRRQKMQKLGEESENEQFEIINCNCEANKCLDICDCSCHDYHEDKPDGDLINYIRYCKKEKKIFLPVNWDFFNEILERADLGLTTHIRHIKTKEGIQEELLTCLGVSLKEKLQQYWRNIKEQEITRLYFVQTCTNYLIENILESKKEGLQLSLIEEYLQKNEEKRQKQKNRNNKKKEKKKQKKKAQDVPQSLPLGGELSFIDRLDEKQCQKAMDRILQDSTRWREIETKRKVFRQEVEQRFHDYLCSCSPVCP